MSQELAEGVHASTRIAMAGSREGPFNDFSLYGNAVNTDLWFRPMHEATDTIYEVTHEPGRFEEGVMANIRGYVANLNLVRISEDNGYGRPVDRFEPSPIAETHLQRAYSARGGEPVSLFGIDVDGAGFAIFVNYVMTTNELWPEDWEGKTEDPRVAMVDKFQSQPGPIEAQPVAQQ